MSDYLNRPDSLAKYRIIHSEHLQYRINEPILVSFNESATLNLDDLNRLEQNYYDIRLLDSSQRFKALHNKFNGVFYQFRHYITDDADIKLLRALGKKDSDLSNIVFYTVFYDKLHNRATDIKLSSTLFKSANYLIDSYQELKTAYKAYYADKTIKVEFKFSADDKLARAKYKRFITSFQLNTRNRQGRTNIDLILQPNVKRLPKVIVDARSQLIINRFNLLQHLYTGVTSNNISSEVEVISLPTSETDYILLHKIDIDNEKLRQFYKAAEINDELKKLTDFLASNKVVQIMLLRCELYKYNAMQIEYLFPSLAVYGLPELIRLSAV